MRNKEEMKEQEGVCVRLMYLQLVQNVLYKTKFYTEFTKLKRIIL